MIIMVLVVAVIKYQWYMVKSQSFSQYVWSMWSEWPMACSTTCKLGQRCRIRKCEDVRGKLMEASLCGNPKNVKECQNCVAKGICPIDAGWSDWYEWSECQILDGKTCGVGTRDRLRVCNNPKPKYDGMHCIGNSTEGGECLLSCSDPSNQPGFLKELVNEHFRTLNHNVKLLNPGDPITLDCYSLAYLKASTTRKKLFVMWNFNGIHLRPLKELILQDMKSLQSKMNKAGAKTSFQLPRGHIQFTGSKLVIDSVTPSDSGVFTCVLNYDYWDYSNTFFVIMVLGKYEYAKEFEMFTFNSNTDGLEHIEYFDQAEIRWYLNRQLMIHGLLANFENRYYTVYVNKSMEGHWECHLFANYHETKHWIVNSFQLKIGYPRSVLGKLSEIPVLYYCCYYFLIGIILIFVVFASSFLVVKLRVKNLLTVKRECIIEEIQNAQLLLIIARKRAMEKTMELMNDAGQLENFEEYELVDDVDMDSDS